MVSSSFSKENKANFCTQNGNFRIESSDTSPTLPLWTIFGVVTGAGASKLELDHNFHCFSLILELKGINCRQRNYFFESLWQISASYYFCFSFQTLLKVYPILYRRLICIFIHIVSKEMWKEEINRNISYVSRSTLRIYGTFLLFLLYQWVIE